MFSRQIGNFRLGISQIAQRCAPRIQRRLRPSAVSHSLPVMTVLASHNRHLSISTKLKKQMESSSWIRKMFEEGAQLKAKYGEENVFDFTIGNPNMAPPAEFTNALKRVVDNLGSHDHGYMPNAGYLSTRSAVADTISKEQGVTVTSNDVIMTCGAAGALNVILKTILNAGEEVIVNVPYFVEYGSWIDNAGGTVVKVPTTEDFMLDVPALAAAIGPKTKAVIVNSPNNPTGQVYSDSNLQELAEALQTANAKYNDVIYLVTDEPYRNIVYNDLIVPGVMSIYPHSIVATSYSKDLSIPGERIGWLCVNPSAADYRDLIAGMTIVNRTLGFVNAPSLMQRVIAETQGASVDMAAYTRKRSMLCEGLSACGYEFTPPRGAFYIWVKSPQADEVAFVQRLAKRNILAVPGSGFGTPGYFRLAFCCSDETITNSMPAFKETLEEFRAFQAEGNV